MSTAATKFAFDNKGQGDHDPLLYQANGQIEPITGFEAVGDAQIRSFHEHGFLAVARLFNEDDLAAAHQGLDDLLDRNVPGHPDDMVLLEHSARDSVDTLTRQQLHDAVRKLSYFCEHEPRLGALSRHRHILGIVERIIGGKTKMIQDMALLKPPRIGREKPWHQDHAYFDYPIHTPIVGVWIALDRTTPENGCMHVRPGWHRKGPIIHFKRRDWQICDTDILDQSEANCMAVPLDPGGALFFSSLLPHGTPINLSPQRRRALQYHYAPVDTKPLERDERLDLFGSEGKNVSC